MSQVARWIRSGAQPGHRNMAVDQALLDHCSHRPVLRFYHWSAPTLSLGYFQKHSQRSTHAASRTCPMLRRSTGGGAIVHDRELTYSLLIPMDQVPHRSADLYDDVHLAFCQILDSLGVSAVPFEPSFLAPEVPVDQKAFLCFQRRAHGDVVAFPSPQSDQHQHPGHKLLGSAQRKQKNALLQHGSILLDQSPAAPELPGIMQMPGYRGPKQVNDLASRIQDALAKQLAERWDWELQADQLTQPEEQSATQWCAARFENDDWNLAR